MGLTYFKRYRMEMELDQLPPTLPSLPSGYRCIPWEESLLEDHAETKYRCFCYEIDANVFPCLGERDGCQRLMNQITQRDNFLPQATWLMEHRTSEGEVDFCGTIQGLRDQLGRGAVQNVGITPEHRGAGLGTALLVRALDGFREHGLTRATLEVTAQNSGALRLYQRLGFQVIKTVFKAAEVALA
ncbi:MAG: GNAT family N-acetyltransferase [Planctomycetaceae bacterium]|nr:GNAT family N-acetyltransferase [Planctomycetaceae bacterium]